MFTGKGKGYCLIEDGFNYEALTKFSELQNGDIFEISFYSSKRKVEEVLKEYFTNQAIDWDADDFYWENQDNEITEEDIAESIKDFISFCINKAVFCFDTGEFVNFDQLLESVVKQIANERYKYIQKLVKEEKDKEQENKKLEQEIKNVGDEIDSLYDRVKDLQSKKIKLQSEM